MGAYLAWLQERTQSIELRGIERSGASPVVALPLDTAYVPLRARSLRPLGDRQGSPGEAGPEALVRQSLRRGAEEAGDRDDGDPSSGGETDLALSEVLALGNRLAIIGGPGCGKTTVLLHIAWALASSLLAGEAEPARSRLVRFRMAGETGRPSTLTRPAMPHMTQAIRCSESTTCA